MRVLNPGTSCVAAPLALAMLFSAGCTSQGDSGAAPAAEHADHDDDHPTEGPHHGSLIELGDEQYHAELVHDEQAGQVAVYLLDSDAKHAVGIDSAEIKINLSHDGAPEQYSLAAAPQASDASGVASRFVSTNAELLEHLDHADSGATLVVTINGTQYRGAVAHDDHAHE